MLNIESNKDKRPLKLTGFKLYPHQYAVSSELDIYEKSGKIVVVNACRQVGKSWLAVHELIKFSAKPKNTSALVTTSFRLARTLYDHVNNLLYNTGLVIKTNAQGLSITLANGSEISFYSAEQREKLRGYTISGILIIDEAAFISDNIYYDYLRPWVNVHKAPTLILSTPDFERGFFYDLLNKGFNNEPGIISIDFMDYPKALNVLRSAETLEQARDNLPIQTFRSEYLGLFKRAEGTVFGNFENLILPHSPDPVEKIYFGIDWATGSGGDYTVVSGFNQAHQLCYLWRNNELEVLAQIKQIEQIFKQYNDKIDGIMVESNSIGKTFLSLLRNTTKHKIIPFETTARTKRQIIELMQVDIQNARVFFLDDRELKLEFSAFEAKAYENKIIYSAPPGQHDDVVMSVLIANMCFKKCKSKIKYLCD